MYTHMCIYCTDVIDELQMMASPIKSHPAHVDTLPEVPIPVIPERKHS